MFIWWLGSHGWRCLQCMKENTNKVEKNVVVRTNCHCKEEFVGPVQEKSQWLNLCFYLCPAALWTSLQLGNASTMEVNTDWKSLRILIFMGLKRPLNSLKNEVTKNEENLSETVKHYIQCKVNVCKFLTSFFIWSIIGRVCFRDISFRV